MSQHILKNSGSISPTLEGTGQQGNSRKSIHVSEGEAQRYAARQQANLARKRAFRYSLWAILTLCLGLSTLVNTGETADHRKNVNESASHAEVREVTDVLATTLDDKQVRLNQAIAALDEAHQKTLLLKTQVEQLQEKLQAITTAKH